MWHRDFDNIRRIKRDPQKVRRSPQHFQSLRRETEAARQFASDPAVRRIYLDASRIMAERNRLPAQMLNPATRRALRKEPPGTSAPTPSKRRGTRFSRRPRRPGIAWGRKAWPPLGSRLGARPPSGATSAQRSASRPDKRTRCSKKRRAWPPARRSARQYSGRTPRPSCG